ncbi:hypothetical protein AAFC00_001470 [Neodothiora populina]|uniref:Zinc finger Mcm10/DnaG-type domain-containing protein n=1 Tax=Neodothiora populina TaxID=2781224 RepID=A0ABR3PP08_9PEZI
MVIARASPNAKVSPDKNNANWPPKSPYEALLSSPSGRKRWEEHHDRFSRRDASPSPRGKPVTTSRALQALQNMSDDEDGRNRAADDDEDDNDDDEDEEMLRLKLQAIEAKLKLKKLQNKRKQSSASNDHNNDVSSSSLPASPRKRIKLSSLDVRPGVEIPVSPVKDRMPPPDLPKQHTSPARVLLGIDKGLKAKDVSLKRARPGAHSSTSGAFTDAKPAPSFSERIAATRLSNEEQEAKQDRIQQARSRGFALPHPPLSRPSSSATSRATPPPSSSSSDAQRPPLFRKPLSFSSDAGSTLDSPFVTRTRTTPASALPPSSRFSHIDGDSEGKSTEPSEDGSAFESFSALHLSRRTMPHTDLVRGLDGKELYTLPRLLKEVKAPLYDPPDCESDYVVLAIIASKSSPYTTKAKHQTTSNAEPDLQEEINPRNKFMVLTLTDLKWEVDLFLFDTAFTRFWKLTPGTLVAILNPLIMPPKANQHNGRFSLKLGSSDDSILEIGNARDLGFCKSIKKDGKECGSWVNKRKSQFCEYHVELAVEKTRKSRMEVNSMYRPTGNASFKPNSRRPGEHPSGLRKDYESGGQFYMGGRGGLSAAKLLDAEDLGKAEAMRKRLKAREKERILGEKLGRLGNGMGAEYLQASSAAASSSTNPSDKNKPPKTTTSTTSSSATTIDRPNAYDHDLDPEALGLLSKKAADVDLSRPTRPRKRAFQPSSSQSTVAPSPRIRTTGGSTEAMGWGGANRRLGYGAPPPVPASPEKGQTNLHFSVAAAADRSTHEKQRRQTQQDQPACTAIASNTRSSRSASPRKRARFDLEGKGVREPGRDSLGGAVAVAAVAAASAKDNNNNNNTDFAAADVRRDAKGRVIVTQAPDSSDDDLDIF